jgi:hypothetical protein
MCSAAAKVRWRRGFLESTLLSCTNAFMWSQRYQSRVVKSGDLGGHAMGPPRPKQRLGNIRFKCCLTCGVYCGGAPSCWKHIWLLIINGISSNKPGNSFLWKTSYVFPVKLLSKIKGPINLLPSKPHHTLPENLLWKLVTLVSCGLSRDHACRFRDLFIPSRVKDTSSVNKMTPNSWGCAFIRWHKSIL